MKFLDLARVTIRSGSGGNGCISFRREKYVEFGGPDGGDGGKGGDVTLVAVDGLNTLIDFRYQQHFFAKNGKGGMGKQRTGASGEDIVLKVPVGTEILDEDEATIIADLERNKVNYVLISNRAIAKSEPGLGVFGTTYCPILAKYIADNFEPIAQFGDWTNEPGWAWNHGTQILKRKGLQK